MVKDFRYLCLLHTCLHSHQDLTRVPNIWRPHWVVKCRPAGKDRMSVKLVINFSHSIIWVRSQRCDCYVTLFCCQLTAKPGNKIVTPLCPDPSTCMVSRTYSCCCVEFIFRKHRNIFAFSRHSPHWTVHGFIFSAAIVLTMEGKQVLEGWISTACVIWVLRNDRRYKYIFMFDSTNWFWYSKWTLCPTHLFEPLVSCIQHRWKHGFIQQKVALQGITTCN